MNVQWINMAGFGPSAWNHGGQPVHTFAKPCPPEQKSGEARQAGQQEGSALSARRADTTTEHNHLSVG